MPLQLQTNRTLSELSTFGIGGPIHLTCEVRSVDDLREAYAFAAREALSTLILGKGSNSLFNDAPFEGLVILNKIELLEISGSEVSAGAGTSFSLLGAQTARRGLSGLEFASGIPATVGGAIFMNAGANGQETASTLQSVSYLFPTGELQVFQRDALLFNYRTSPFQAMNGCIVSAQFRLVPSPDARRAQLALIERRMQTQPLKDKSAGCIFRNPTPHLSAGALIDQCGLKGTAIGGARISPLHANFIVNTGNARASDVRLLIALIQERVRLATGVELEPEIRIWL